MTKKIPRFKSIQEEAEFWDTHDFTDFENEFQAVKMVYKPKLEKSVSVRFPQDDLKELSLVAHNKGIGVTTLIRMISLDFLSNKKNLAA